MSRGEAIPDDVVVTHLGRDDLPRIGTLFADHTGRSADLDTIEAWISSYPSAGARRDDALVGYLLCNRFAPDIVELASLLVAPSERGRGLGGRLIRHVEAEAARRGMAAMVAAPSMGYRVRDDKISSRPLFERLGYRTVVETDITAIMSRHLP